MSSTAIDAGSRVGSRSGQASGLTLSPLIWLSVASGTIGGLVFTAAYALEGATRQGYDWLAQPISALSLGPGGWVQSADFVLFGLLMVVSAVGWGRLLAAGRAAVAFPALRALAGLALILDGVFSQDPSGGYPPGARAAHTLAGQLHTAFAALAIGSPAASWFVLARRLKAEPAWRAWAPAAALTGVLSLVFIAAFGAAGAHGGVAGLFERLAGGVDSLLGLALVVALLARLRAESTGTVKR
jgi:hypothetical membrane protein